MTDKQGKDHFNEAALEAFNKNIGEPLDKLYEHTEACFLMRYPQEIEEIFTMAAYAAKDSVETSMKAHEGSITPAKRLADRMITVVFFDVGPRKDTLAEDIYSDLDIPIAREYDRSTLIKRIAVRPLKLVEFYEMLLITGTITMIEMIEDSKRDEKKE